MMFSINIYLKNKNFSLTLFAFNLRIDKPKIEQVKTCPVLIHERDVS